MCLFKRKINSACHAMFAMRPNEKKVLRKQISNVRQKMFAHLARAQFSLLDLEALHSSISFHFLFMSNEVSFLASNNFVIVLSDKHASLISMRLCWKHFFTSHPQDHPGRTIFTG